jgi:anaerobic selenocysteine-containing dehydrogenase
MLILSIATRLIFQTMPLDCFSTIHDVVAHITAGSLRQDLEAARYCRATQAGLLSMWSMGLNQSGEGNCEVRTLINLHLMTAQIQQTRSGSIFTLTGQYIQGTQKPGDYLICCRISPCQQSG